MNITFLNGSPKRKDATSLFLLNALEERLKNHTIFWHHSLKTNSLKLAQDIAKSQILFIAFPLYIDGVPSHLLKLLECFEKENQEKKIQATVYVISNCGFYEGRQNQLALNMIELWSKSAHLNWGYGIGVGAGGMVQMNPMGKGPNTSFGKALAALAENSQKSISQETIFVQPNFPRFLYRYFAHLGWRKDARKNNLSVKALLNRLDS